MPLPKPKPSGETNEQWMARCMGDAAVKNDFADPKQRVAYCLNIWRQHHGPAANGPKPKAASPAACYPKPDETQAQFMSRCQDGGDTEEACIMSWNADKASPPAVDRDVQMKWMPTKLEVRSLNSDRRELFGTATTRDVDAMGDIVESGGARYSLPVPLLLHHDHSRPCGQVFAAERSADGITFGARIPKTDTPGVVKDRLDEAWDSLRLGLIKGVSIGFTPVAEKYERIKGGIRWMEWDWRELSLVVIPANSSATVAVIRSLDERARGLTAPPALSPSLKPAAPKITAKQDPVVAWINDFSRAPEWQRQLAEPAVRYQNEIQVAKRAAVNARLRQPSGDITQEQIRSEIWELRRYW
jgi:HK97 family phage prohead protease